MIFVDELRFRAHKHDEHAWMKCGASSFQSDYEASRELCNNSHHSSTRLFTWRLRKKGNDSYIVFDHHRMITLSIKSHRGENFPTKKNRETRMDEWWWNITVIVACWAILHIFIFSLYNKKNLIFKTRKESLAKYVERKSKVLACSSILQKLQLLGSQFFFPHCNSNLCMH